jgi:hypothetical protein
MMTSNGQIGVAADGLKDRKSRLNQAEEEAVKGTAKGYAGGSTGVEDPYEAMLREKAAAASNAPMAAVAADEFGGDGRGDIAPQVSVPQVPTNNTDLRYGTNNDPRVVNPNQPMQVRAPMAAPQGGGTSFAHKTAQVEAGGDPNAVNPETGFVGYGQFKPETYAGLQKNNPGKFPHAYGSEAFKEKNYQLSMIDTLQVDDIKALGVVAPKTDGAKYGLHMLGQSDYKKVYTAPAAAPIATVLRAKVIEQNPQFEGKTAGEVRAWMDSKMATATARPATAPQTAATNAAQADSDRKAGWNLARPHAWVADAISNRANDLSGVIESGANAIGVPRMGRALGIYGNDVNSVEMPKIAGGKRNPVTGMIDEMQAPNGVPPVGSTGISPQPNPAPQPVASVQAGEVALEGENPVGGTAVSYDASTDAKLGNAAQARMPQVEAAKAEAAKIADPVERKSWLENAISGIFSEDGLFTPQELKRFAFVAAGSIFTGGSVGGSLRFAGKDLLTASDSRRAAQATLEGKQVTAKNAALAANMTRQQSLLKGMIDEQFKSGELNEEGRKKAMDNLLANDLVSVHKMLDSKENQTELRKVGLPNDAKTVNITTSGKTGVIQAYHDPKNPDGFIIPKQDADGKTKYYRTKGDKGATYGLASGNNDLDSRINVAKGEIDESHFNKSGPKGETEPTFPKGSEKEMYGQIRSWSLRQKKLGLDDDPTSFMPAINAALRVAARTGAKFPNIGAIMDTATINTASLTNQEKVSVRGGALGIPAEYYGKVNEDINRQFKDGKPFAGASDPREYMTKVEAGFEKVRGKPNLVASLLNGIEDPAARAKISGAPNDWWAYVYRNIYEGNKK